jgi:predicted Zn-dependent protease
MAGCLCCGGRLGRGLSRRTFLAGTTAGVLVAGPAGAGPVTDFLGSFISPEQERQLGEQAFAELKQSQPRSPNRALQERLEQVGRRVIAASEPEVPASQWEFVVFAGDQVNAFALPGGKVGFFEGIFRIMENDAQLATVVGHEVAHVNARHTAERIGAAVATDVGTSVLGWALGIDPSTGAGRLAGSLLGAGADLGILRPYGRSQELEADRLGLTYMAKAGYDPRESLDFWQRMAQAGGGSPPPFLSTHPSDESRIARLQELMPEAVAIYEQNRG